MPRRPPPDRFGRSVLPRSGRGWGGGQPASDRGRSAAWQVAGSRAVSHAAAAPSRAVVHGNRPVDKPRDLPHRWGGDLWPAGGGSNEKHIVAGAGTSDLPPYANLSGAVDRREVHRGRPVLRSPSPREIIIPSGAQCASAAAATMRAGPLRNPAEAAARPVVRLPASATPTPRRAACAHRCSAMGLASSRDGGPYRGGWLLQRKRTLRGAGSRRGGPGGARRACRRGLVDSSGARQAIARGKARRGGLHSE